MTRAATFTPTWTSIDVGYVWFIDNFSERCISKHEAVRGSKWRRFSHKGILKELVKPFRDFICTGQPLHPGYLGPERFDDSNIWGYDEAGMKAVREQAGALPVFRQPVAEAA